MKFFLLFILISTFSCEIVPLKKYKETMMIKDGYGLIVLDASEFETGDKIHITYKACNGSLTNILYYSFSDTYPDSATMELSEQINPYDEGQITKEHNYTNRHTGTKIFYKTHDYHYYYEIEKKQNSKYLIMRYSFSTTKVNYLMVENTKLDQKTYIIVIISIAIVITLIAGSFILYVIYRNKCSKKVRSTDINYNSKNPVLSIEPNSQIIPPNEYDKNPMPMESKYDTDKPSYIQNNLPPSNFYPQNMNQPDGVYPPPTSDTTYNSS